MCITVSRMNFCTESLDPKISSNKPGADGREVSNLVSIYFFLFLKRSLKFDHGELKNCCGSIIVSNVSKIGTIFLNT